MRETFASELAELCNRTGAKLHEKHEQADKWADRFGKTPDEVIRAAFKILDERIRFPFPTWPEVRDAFREATAEHNRRRPAEVGCVSCRDGVINAPYEPPNYGGRMVIATYACRCPAGNLARQQGAETIPGPAETDRLWRAYDKQTEAAKVKNLQRRSVRRPRSQAPDGLRPADRFDVPEMSHVKQVADGVING